MGCCVSTKKSPTTPEFQRHSSKSSRAPPPVDEETVKEVLSETPNANHFSKIEDEPTKYVPRKIQHQQNNNLQDMNVSEICSTMSESNSTTTFEEDVEVLRRRVTDRSPAKLRNPQQISGELRVVRNSPVRGKQQSPGRVRSVSEINNRGSGYYSTGRQRPVPASRSRSPANRVVGRGGGGGARNGIGRSPSARKTESSPSRSGSGLPERVLKPDVSSGIDTEREESSWAPTDGNDDESIDNPLVSLECFIFL
ncbi:uncharacterized protein LOC112523742 [Cynara cardunculus var. scolymus]|uniref:uncharacterized protein LOC112523742 n=1 Tax=Cynara cardunculus var. scolymus TaxID=59895 RepID=UPI000D62F6CC|nr:uncharacterized protein LOC112523742 [Cynara cardunculus var. scolymus]